DRQNPTGNGGEASYSAAPTAGSDRARPAACQGRRRLMTRHPPIRTACALATLCLGLALAAPALADGTLFQGKKNRSAVFKSQTALLDGRLSEQYSGSIKLTPDYKAGKVAKGEGAETVPKFRGAYRGKYLEVAKAAAKKHGIPEDLFLRLVQQESGWNPGAVSHKGATGLAQL